MTQKPLSDLSHNLWIRNELCILCSKDIGVGEFVSLRQIGTDSINKASKERGNELETKPGSVVQKSCSLQQTNAKNIEFCQTMKEEATTKQRRLHYSDSTFDFRTDCVFCDNTTESNNFMAKVR